MTNDQNDEARITNDERITNRAENAPLPVIWVSTFLRASSFGFRHCTYVLLVASRQLPVHDKPIFFRLGCG
jgi:hypothetical protein